MPLAHRDGRCSEIDEQRAVRAEAARPARGGRAQLSSQQPVARRERGTLALGEHGPRPGHAREPRERRSEEHTSELQSQSNLVCRLLLEKKKKDLILTAVYIDHDEDLCTVSPITNRV